MSLLLLLSWLKLAHDAAEREWLQLRCAQYPHLPFDFPSVPDLTPADRSLVRMDVDVLWRVADAEAVAYLRAHVDADHAAREQTTFLFHEHFHENLCILKSNHRRMIDQTARALSSFL